MEGYLSSTTHLGNESRILGKKEYPIGTSFSIRKTLLYRIGSFNPILGRIGKNFLSGEEMELCQRLRMLGSKIFFASDVLVYHRVQEKRTRACFFFLKRAYWKGISDAIVEENKSTISKFAIPFYIASFSYQILKGLFTATLRLIDKNLKQAFTQCFFAMERAGWISRLFISLFDFKKIQFQI
jgi:GT2 family glycosyltransferase